jgi:hypothetical protein
MKRIVRLTENDLVRLVKKVINEENNINPTKEKISKLISEIRNMMTYDMWRDADDLMMVYRKLLPLKGVKTGVGVASDYQNVFDGDKDMRALEYFNKMWGQRKGNKYGMGNPFDFIKYIDSIGEKTMLGGEEKTSDGKYSTKQVKEMIIKLINNG